MPGTIIRRFRELRKFSQKEMAGRMGISQNAYSKIENNVTQLTVKHLKQLSQILDVSVMELLKDDFEIHKPMDIHDKAAGKQDITTLLIHIRQNLEEKKKSEHELYPVILALLRTIDEIAANID